MPTSLATGRYSYTMTITQNYEVGQTITPYSGMKDVLNWNSSPFGQGWNLDGLDQLVVYESGDVSLVKSDGTMTYFTSAGGGTFTSEDGPFKFMTLALVDVDDVETYELTGTDGTMETFNSTSGQLTSVVDKDGNVTSYNYTSGLLSSIVDPSHHTTTFTYTDGLLTTITDFAGRETTLAYTSGQLTSITEPDPGDGETTPVMTFGYDPTSGLMTSYVDTDGNSTEFVYRADGTLDTATSADGPAMTYQSAVAAGQYHRRRRTGQRGESVAAHQRERRPARCPTTSRKIRRSTRSTPSAIRRRSRTRWGIRRCTNATATAW